MPVANLIFKRGGQHGKEIKEDDISLKRAHLYNMICICLELGVPTKEGEKRLNFSVAQRAPAFLIEGGVVDNVFYLFSEPFMMPINTRRRVAEVKKLLAAKLNELYTGKDAEMEPAEVAPPVEEEKDKVETTDGTTEVEKKRAPAKVIVPEGGFVPEKLRLREKNADKLTKVMYDSDLLE